MKTIQKLLSISENLQSKGSIQKRTEIFQDLKNNFSKKPESENSQAEIEPGLWKYKK